MGIETIDNAGGEYTAGTADDYDEVIRRAIKAAQFGTDTPVDGGWGAEMTGSHEMEAGAAKASVPVEAQGISYAGEPPVVPDRPPEGFTGFPTMP